MWDFISTHGQVLTLCVTAATLVVWTVYGQLLAKGLYRSQLPRLFLKQADGQSLHSRCYLANMGLESAYLRSVFIDMQTADGQARGTVNAYRPASDEQACGGDMRTGILGPLPANTHINLGRFSDLLQASAFDADWGTAQDSSPASAAIQGFTITAVLNYGPNERFIGAVRDFDIDDAGERVIPSSTGTRQLKGRRAARRLKSAVREIMRSDY
ncbi:hypothetical protein [Salinisphaera sp.]|uniref:hypothetical protein n=1 Tax=Salinisphaera sp. TaxID=1914330 RepID=UPI000C65ABDF|nr:hypothetical protein [Salinisphaera sp.]MBS62536.1 hypothetical protein [Salinisphaera sp.]